MRLNRQLSICVGISLLMLTAIVKSSDIDDLNINKETANIQYKTEPKVSYSLDEFIRLSLLNNQNMQEEALFNHLNTKKIINNTLLFSSKESLADYHLRLEKLKKMQKLALYIKENYAIPLNHSEQIVLSAFEEAKKKDLEPMLVLSVIGVESTFKQYPKSGAGAIGLTQFIPKYHKEKIAKLKNQDMWSISGNIQVGTDVLKEYLILSNGNIRSALQRYNGSLGDNQYKYSTKVFAKMKKLNKALSR